MRTREVVVPGLCPIALADTAGRRSLRTLSLQINVISTGLLALRALPVLGKTADLPGDKSLKPHLVIVASEVHEWAKLVQQDQPNIIEALNTKEKATVQDTYNISKRGLQVGLERCTLPGLTNGPALSLRSPRRLHGSRDRKAICGFQGHRNIRQSWTLQVGAARRPPPPGGSVSHMPYDRLVEHALSCSSAIK